MPINPLAANVAATSQVTRLAATDKEREARRNEGVAQSDRREVEQVKAPAEVHEADDDPHDRRPPPRQTDEDDDVEHIDVTA